MGVAVGAIVGTAVSVGRTGAGVVVAITVTTVVGILGTAVGEAIVQPANINNIKLININNRRNITIYSLQYEFFKQQDSIFSVVGRLFAV
jgi:hypothetical protein